jgi:hypothetical protein
MRRKFNHGYCDRSEKELVIILTYLTVLVLFIYCQKITQRLKNRGFWKKSDAEATPKLHFLLEAPIFRNFPSLWISLPFC